MRPPVQAQSIPLKIVGSNKFGRYSKMSSEETFNMIISDGWLVPYAGYEIVSHLSNTFPGRALYASERWGNMIAVVGNVVYGVLPPEDGSSELTAFFIGNLATFVGDVFIDENIAGQIAICDGKDIWIYDWTSTLLTNFTKATLPIDPATSQVIIPGYITYQDTYFITVNKESASWFLSAPSDGLSWNWGAGGLPVTTTIQTKPTNAVAAVRAPGRGNLLYVFGSNVTEMWNDVGAALFPYQRNNSVSIDYGCLNANTIAAMDNMIVWLGVNERSGPVIMMCSGADATRLSNDGIDFKLDSLKNPQLSYGFFFKQDGHLFYQITFADPRDNLTLVYDFNTQAFFTMTDHNMNFHIAKRMSFFSDDYYFVSASSGDIYRMSSELTSYDDTLPNATVKKNHEIPRVRICPSIQLPDSSRFVVNSLTFTIEQGEDSYFPMNTFSLLSTQQGEVLVTENDLDLQTEFVLQPYQPRVDLALSKDGGVNFSSNVAKFLNPQGNRKNRVVYWQLGTANDLVCQLRFWSKSRVVVTDGVINIYQ